MPARPQPTKALSLPRLGTPDGFAKIAVRIIVARAMAEKSNTSGSRAEALSFANQPMRVEARGVELTCARHAAASLLELRGGGEAFAARRSNEAFRRLE